MKTGNMGELKFFVETHENAHNYGILVIENEAEQHKRRGHLKYYTKLGEEVTDFEEMGDGWKELSNRLFRKALTICKENNAQLWSF